MWLYSSHLLMNGSLDMVLHANIIVSRRMSCYVIPTTLSLTWNHTAHALIRWCLALFWGITIILCSTLQLASVSYCYYKETLRAKKRCHLEFMPSTKAWHCPNWSVAKIRLSIHEVKHFGLTDPDLPQQWYVHWWRLDTSILIQYGFACSFCIY